MEKHYIVSESDLLAMMTEVAEYHALKKDSDFRNRLSPDLYVRAEKPNLPIPYEEYTLPQELYSMFREKRDLGSFAADSSAVLRMYDFVRSKIERLQE